MATRRRRRAGLGALFALATTSACALQLSGLGGDAPSPAADAGSTDDALVSEASVPSEQDADASVALDAAMDADADPCPPIVTLESFSNGIPATWHASGQTAANAADGGTGAYVTLIPVGQTGKVAGLWWTAPQSFDTFAVDFRIRATRNGTTGTVSDGLALAWLAVADDAGALDQAVGGVGLGLPRGAKGYAFVLDVYDNGGAVKDPNVPYYGLVTVDSTKDPGTYDWHMQSTGALANAFGAWHAVSLRVAAGVANVSVDGATVLNNATGFTGFRGTLGFAAAVGGVTGAGFDVDEVKLTTPNPACGG